MSAKIQSVLKDDARFAKAARSEPPGRFPRKVLRDDPPLEELADIPAAAVLSSEAAADSTSPQASLQFVAPDGKLLRTVKGFECYGGVGGFHLVVVDAKRRRIYVSETGGRRITALDAVGNRIWQIERIDVGAIALDPHTGHLWCCVGQALNLGETVIIDRDGREVTSFPHRGVDVAYDAKTDAFWLAGHEIKKLNRDGQVLFERPISGWTTVSVSVNDSDGSVWLAERAHGDVPRSKNRVWHLDSRGNVLQEIQLDDIDPACVEWDAATGIAWVGGFNGLLRIDTAQKLIPVLSEPARSIAIDPRSGGIWIAGPNAARRINREGSTKVDLSIARALSVVSFSN